MTSDPTTDRHREARETLREALVAAALPFPSSVRAEVMADAEFLVALGARREGGLREWALNPNTTLDAAVTVTAGDIIELVGLSPAGPEEPQEGLPPEGWRWACAGCHRPVAPMGMCETCGVFGVMETERRVKDDPHVPQWEERRGR